MNGFVVGVGVYIPHGPYPPRKGSERGGQALIHIISTSGTAHDQFPLIGEGQTTNRTGPSPYRREEVCQVNKG